MNEAFSGDISKHFIVFSTRLNRRMLQKALDQSKSQIRVTREEKEATISYADKISCN